MELHVIYLFNVFFGIRFDQEWIERLNAPRQHHFRPTNDSKREYSCYDYWIVTSNRCQCRGSYFIRAYGNRLWPWDGCGCERVNGWCGEHGETFSKQLPMIEVIAWETLAGLLVELWLLVFVMRLLTSNASDSNLSSSHRFPSVP